MNRTIYPLVKYRNSLILLFIVCSLPGCKNFSSVKNADSDSSATNKVLKEAHRPLFHFTPPAQWMNDPNGMVYYEGEYHLFYQYFPDSTVWGPMHWGHAVSTNLIDWQHLPIALYPDTLGYIFSGSAVVDEKNTSGFQSGSTPPLIAIYTYHLPKDPLSGKENLQTQGLAYSTDKGRTWTKYKNNPVIKNPNAKDFRDPKVRWHEASQYWSMCLAVGDHIEFYRSKNLWQWEKTGSFGLKEGAHGGVWECPDLFPLTISGSEQQKWVLLVSIGDGGINGGSATQYFVGDFDGQTFKNDNTPSTILWADYGKDNYAGVTWSNAPEKKPVFLGWMSNWQYAQTVPTTTWRSAMTLPRLLELVNTSKGLRLSQTPIPAIKNYRAAPLHTINHQQVLNTHSIAHLKEPLFDIEATIDLSASTCDSFYFEWYNPQKESIQIGFSVSTQQWYINRSQSGITHFSTHFIEGVQKAPRQTNQSIMPVRIIGDATSVEVFIDGGTTALTTIFFPGSAYQQLHLVSRNGILMVNNLLMWPLKPASFIPVP